MDADWIYDNVAKRTKPARQARVWLTILVAGSYFVLWGGAIVGLFKLAFWMDNMSYPHILAGFFMFIPFSLLLTGLPLFPHKMIRGVCVRRDDCPELHERLAALAQTLGWKNKPMLYLSAEFGARAAIRGGAFGFGARPTFWIGLPLMRMLTVSELETLMAHCLELSRDRLADLLIPALHRSIDEVCGLVFYGRALTKPLRWYGERCLRILENIHRRRLLQADRLVAEIAGSDILIDALLKNENPPRETPNSFPDVRAVFETADRIPVVMGLETGASAPPCIFGGTATPDDVGRAKVLAGIGVDDEEDRYDILYKRRSESIHVPGTLLPTFAERLDYLSLWRRSEHRDRRGSLRLLIDVSPLNRRILAAKLRVKYATFDQFRIDASATEEWVETWARTIELYRPALTGIRLKDLPQALTGGLSIFEALLAGRGIDGPEYVIYDCVKDVLGVALAYSLYTDGWKVHSRGGHQWLVRRSIAIDPFEAMDEIAAGQMSPEDWKMWIRSLELHPSLPLTGNPLFHRAVAVRSWFRERIGRALARVLPSPPPTLTLKSNTD